MTEYSSMDLDELIEALKEARRKYEEEGDRDTTVLDAVVSEIKRRKGAQIRSGHNAQGAQGGGRRKKSKRRKSKRRKSKRRKSKKRKTLRRY